MQGNITTKYFLLQPGYMDTRHIKVTVSKVPVALSDHVLASFLSKYGRLEEITPVRGSIGAVIGDYSFLISVKREGLASIPDIISSVGRQAGESLSRADGLTAGPTDSKGTYRSIASWRRAKYPIQQPLLLPLKSQT